MKLKTEHYIFGGAVLFFGYTFFNRRNNQFETANPALQNPAIGYTGAATIRKTLGHLAKAEKNLWDSGSGYTLSRPDQLKLGEARLLIIEVIENNGYKVDFDKGLVRK